MDRYIGITIGKKKVHVSILCAIAYLYLCRSSFLVFAKQFSLTSIFAGLILITFAACFVLYTISDPRNISWDGIVLILIVALFFYLSLLIHPEYADRYEDAIHGGRYGARAIFRYGSGIYVYYIIRLFQNKVEKLFKLFKTIAFTILLFDIWAMFDRTQEYLMTFGYQMEMAAIVFIVIYLREKRKKGYLILSLFSILLGVLYGSRGCIIGYVVCIVIYFFWNGHINKRQIIIMTLGVLASISYNSQTVMMFIYKFFSSIGFRSRTLYYIAAGDILSVDQSRQKYIWPFLLERIKEMPPLKGYGAFGDRYLMRSNWAYAHNFVLEMLLTFGIIVGMLFILWMVVQFFLIVRNNKDESGLMTIIFGSFALCRLFFSSSFWMEPYFWAFLAMLINCASKRKKEKIKNKYHRISISSGQYGGQD